METTKDSQPGLLNLEARGMKAKSQINLMGSCLVREDESLLRPMKETLEREREKNELSEVY